MFSVLLLLVFRELLGSLDAGIDVYTDISRRCLSCRNNGFNEQLKFTNPERLIAKRREMGWMIKEAAGVAGIDFGAWGDWEHGQIILYRRHWALITKMLGLSFDTPDQEMVEQMESVTRTCVYSV